VSNQRVRVDNDVYLYRQGKTVDEIRVEYPDLTHAQVHAALAYYHDHKDEIEAELAEDEGADERHQLRKAKALAERHGPQRWGRGTRRSTRPSSRRRCASTGRFTGPEAPGNPSNASRPRGYCFPAAGAFGFRSIPSWVIKPR